MKKLLAGLAPLLAVAAFAMVPPAAMAAGELPCRVLTWGAKSPGVEGKICNNPPGVVEQQNVRETGDGAGTSPISTNFPASGLMVNTKAAMRVSAKVAGVAVRSTCPLGYCFFAVKLEGNPLSSSKECRAATGSVSSADVQDVSTSAVFDDTSAWPFTVESNSTACAEAERGKVIIREVSMLAETLGAGKAPIIATGTVAGKYEQPGANCPAGGVKLEVKQPGVTSEPESTAVEIDNGEEGKNAYLCMVSANNYVYPKEAPKWSLKEGEGIWKD